jgi:hypothetical protein
LAVANWQLSTPVVVAQEALGACAQVRRVDSHSRRYDVLVAVVS